jgi:nucleoside phosphorylase
MSDPIYETADIAIVTPTAGEWQEMLSHLSEAKPSPQWPLPVSFGRIGNHSVICCATGKGQEETASAVTLLIERAKPRWIFLVGIAGGFPDQKVTRGDVVIAHVIHNFDYGKLTSGEFKRRPENDFNCDRTLLSWADVVAGNNNVDWRLNIKSNRPVGDSGKSKAHSDCYIASSNKVVDDPDHEFFAKVKAAFPEIHAVEMEGTGAGASARLAQGEKALGLLMIRGISDEPGVPLAAGSDQRIQWRPYAAAVAAAFTRSLIEQLPNRKGVEQATDKVDASLLGGDANLVDSISLALAKEAPRYRVIFDKAITSASIAHRHSEEAKALERRIKKILAPKLPKGGTLPAAKDVLVIPEPYPDDLGEAGIITWSSGDQFVGQFNEGIEAGLGCYVIHSYTREFSPNAINRYRGEVFGDVLGLYGVYTFENGSEFAGEWAFGVPRLGAMNFIQAEVWYDFYFGSVGSVKSERGPNRWLPDGYGLAFNVRESVVRCTFAQAGEVIYLSDDIKVAQRDVSRMMFDRS